MELVKPNTNSLRLYRIKLFEPTIFSAGKPKGGKDKAYIAGHITDGASTFTFAVNTNESVTVPVDANGNWLWVVDRTITNLYRAFAYAANANLDFLEIKYNKNPIECGFACYENKGLKNVVFNVSASTVRSFLAKNSTEGGAVSAEIIIDSSCTDLGYLVRGQSELKELIIKGDTSNVINYEYLLRLCSKLETFKIPIISAGSNINNSTVLTEAVSIKNIEIDKIFANISWKYQSKLTAQSVVNLFNAVAKDGLTLTFHATVGATIDAALEAGGEGTPEQNAIYNAYWDAYDRGYEINYTY